MANGPPPPNPYGSLRYVDSVAGNLLFRGPSPVQTREDGTSFFDYHGLQAAIAMARPMPLAIDYYLAVINLVHSDEGPHISVEADFFRQDASGNPSGFGQVQFWDTYGTDQCYFRTEPPPLQKELVATLGEWLPDPLIWRVATLRSWLEDPATLPLQPQPPLPKIAPPVAFYVHCDGGCDRTSEMIGAYRLRYMPSSWTMENAWSNMCNEHPCTNVMGCGNYMALEWYAYWLNQTQGFSLTGIGLNDGGCNDGGDIWQKCSPHQATPTERPSTPRGRP